MFSDGFPRLLEKNLEGDGLLRFAASNIHAEDLLDGIMQKRDSPVFFRS